MEPSTRDSLLFTSLLNTTSSTEAVSESSKCPSGATYASDSTGVETCYTYDSSETYQEDSLQVCHDNPGSYPLEFYSDSQITKFIELVNGDGELVFWLFEETRKRRFFPTALQAP